MQSTYIHIGEDLDKDWNQYMDPNLQLPFAEVPATLLPTFAFLQPLAVYFCGVTIQVVGREKKPLVTFLTKDAIFFAKKDSGALARRIPFTAIRSLHSNCPLAQGSSSSGGDPKLELFVMLLLSPQERTDLILVSELAEKFLTAFKRVWAATGFKGRCAWEQDPKKWKRFTDFQRNYRVPQSSRDGSPSIASVENRAAVLSAHHEMMLNQDFPDDAVSGGGQQQVDGPRVTTYRDPATGNESPKYLAMGDHNTFNQQVELPYVSFAADEKVAFPAMGAADRSLFYCERRHIFHTAEGSSNNSGALTNCFVFMSETHLYCAVSEDRILRCCSLKNISKLWWVRDVTEAPFSSSGTIVADKTHAHGVLIQFIERTSDDASADQPNAAQRTLVRVEHDLLLLFSNEDEVKKFSSVLERILLRAHPTNGAKFAPSTSLGHTSAILSPQPGYLMAVASVPQKLGQQASEELRRAKDGGAKGTTGSAQQPSSPRDASPRGGSNPAGSPSGGLSRAKSALQMHKSDLSKSYIGSFKQQGSSMEEYRGLMSIVREDPHLQEEFPVSAELKERHQPLTTGWVYWAERVVYHPSPLRKQAGQRSSEIVVAFLTRSQFVIGSNGNNIRILPIQAIKAIRVKTIPRKTGEHSRQVIVLVGNAQEHDLCIEVDREEDGRVMLHQLLNVIKKADPYNVPAIKSFVDVEAEGFRFEANKFYKAQELDLPLSNDTIAYRREVRQRIINMYKKHQPQKVDRVDPLMKEYAGRELELLEKMKEKFGINSAEFDKNNDDLFGYRKRLIAYCEKYLPESIDAVDRVLREYRGQEDRMFEILVKRFGPEPKELVITPAAKESALRREQSKALLSKLTHKERLLRIYQQYQPSKIGMIDEILKRYEGHEDVLFRKLEKLYGPEPEPDTEAIQRKAAEARRRDANAPEAKAPADTWGGVSYADRVAAMCKRYTPGKVNTIPSVLEQFKGKEKQLLEGLVKKYGPEPIPCTAQSRDRLAAFFANHMEERMPDDRLDEILSSFRGSEEELFASLSKRYGETGPFTPKGGVSDLTTTNKKRRSTAAVASSSSEDEEVEEQDDAAFDVYQDSGATPTGDVERLRLARRRAQRSNRQNGLARSHKKEDKLETEVLAKMDMLTELPFADVPVPAQHLFPTFGRAAIFLFERVLHWEPSMPPSLRFLYLSSSHIYIASSETMVHRCIPIRNLQGVFLTTKRSDQSSQCSVLLKLQPNEHDCFFSVETNFEAKRFVWVLLEVQHKYHQHATACRIVPVESLLVSGIDAQCKPQPGFEVHIEPVKKRHRLLNEDESFGSIAVRNLFSRLHEAVIERHVNEEDDAELDTQEAALTTRASRGVVELSTKDKKIFGVGGSSRFHHGASPRGGRLQSPHEEERGGQLGVSAYQATILTGGSASRCAEDPSGTARFTHRDTHPHADDDDHHGDSHFESREAQRRRLNPIQREQFFLHSHSGIYGTAVSGSLTGSARGDAFAVNGDNDGEIVQGPMSFAEADDPLAAQIDGRVSASGAILPLASNQVLSKEEEFMRSGILGVSEVYHPSPLDRMGGGRPDGAGQRKASAYASGFMTPPAPANVLSVQHFRGANDVGSDRRRLMEAAQNSIHRSLGQPTGGRVTQTHYASPPARKDEPHEHYANVAVAPPPSQQLQFTDSGDFDDYIGGRQR